MQFNYSSNSVGFYLPTKKVAQAEQNLKQYSNNNNNKKKHLKRSNIILPDLIYICIGISLFFMSIIFKKL